ncbi:hypothetical protein C8R43DRAFT_180785 [Mycena crocata]|nr:hypothetical protein C8R43DRAFT_180785 [Mycena crocata]
MLCTHCWLTASTALAWLPSIMHARPHLPFLICRRRHPETAGFLFIRSMLSTNPWTARMNRASVRLSFNESYDSVGLVRRLPRRVAEAQWPQVEVVSWAVYSTLLVHSVVWMVVAVRTL